MRNWSYEMSYDLKTEKYHATFLISLLHLEPDLWNFQRDYLIVDSKIYNLAPILVTKRG